MCKVIALLSQMQQSCLWLHGNQHCVVFKPSSSYDCAQHAVLSISLLCVCVGPMLDTRKRTTVRQACPGYASTRSAKLSASGVVVVCY